MDRRTFLKGSAAALAALSVTPGWARDVVNKDGWLTGYGKASGGYGAAFIDRDLNTTPILSTDLRLHDVLIAPHGSDIVAPARRPGNLLWVVRGDEDVLVIRAPEGRHYFGHATFSSSGETLYIAENDFDGERGAIGIYDARDNYKRIGEFSSHGIGPHELHLTADGQHLIIANGGILTHPDTGRAKLNLDTMEPNLAMVDVHTGRAVETAGMVEDFYQLSLRHFAVTPSGEVVFGVQDQHHPYGERPMVGAWKPGSALRFLDEPDTGWRALGGYIGSVAIDQSGRWAAAASPRGGVVAFWNIRTAKVVASYQEADICGVAPTARPDEFLVSSGQGKLMTLAVSGDLNVLKSAETSVRFDNHCRLV